MTCRRGRPRRRFAHSVGPERRVRRVSFFGSTYFKAIAIHPDELQIVTTGTDRKITWGPHRRLHPPRRRRPLRRRAAAATTPTPTAPPRRRRVRSHHQSIRLRIRRLHARERSSHRTSCRPAALGSRAAPPPPTAPKRLWSDPRGSSVALAELGREKSVTFIAFSRESVPTSTTTTTTTKERAANQPPVHLRTFTYIFLNAHNAHTHTTRRER